MLKFYGSHICSGCREALELFREKGFTDFTFVEITENTNNLREFLKLRDTRPELQEAKREGRDAAGGGSGFSPAGLLRFSGRNG